MQEAPSVLVTDEMVEIEETMHAANSQSINEERAAVRVKLSFAS